MKKSLNQQNLCTKHQSSWFLFRNSQPNNHQWGSWVCTMTIYCDQHSLDSYTHQRISISSDLELYNKQTVHISHTYYIIIYLIPLPSPQEGSRQVIPRPLAPTSPPPFPFSDMAPERGAATWLLKWLSDMGSQKYCAKHVLILEEVMLKANGSHFEWILAIFLVIVFGVGSHGIPYPIPSE